MSLEKELTNYIRVSQNLLCEVLKTYDIITYEIYGDDYLLIVKNKIDPSIQFKATRNEKSKLSEIGWISLGGYYYF